MANRFIMCLRLAPIAVGMFLSLLITAGYAQVDAPLSEVKVTVVDQSGAVIADSEVVFKSDSKTTVSHTGPVGSVTVALPGGRYAVTTTHLGFLKNEVSDFEVVVSKPNELKITLKVDPDSCKDNRCIPGPGSGDVPILLVPTDASGVPNAIEAKPSPVPSVQPPTKPRRIRSLQCLYLWKCSTA